MIQIWRWLTIEILSNDFRQRISICWRMNCLIVMTLFMHVFVCRDAIFGSADRMSLWGISKLSGSNFYLFGTSVRGDGNCLAAVLVKWRDVNIWFVNNLPFDNFCRLHSSTASICLLLCSVFDIFNFGIVDVFHFLFWILGREFIKLIDFRCLG